jgi:hypothetical protein
MFNTLLHSRYNTFRCTDIVTKFRICNSNTFQAIPLQIKFKMAADYDYDWHPIARAQNAFTRADFVTKFGKCSSNNFHVMPIHLKLKMAAVRITRNANPVTVFSESLSALQSIANRRSDSSPKLLSITLETIRCCQEKN